VQTGIRVAGDRSPDPDVQPASAPSPDGAAVPPDHREVLPRAGRAKVVAAAAAPIVLYLVFVNHFGRNGITWDDWSFVPIVDAAIHHHLSFGQLWQQHNENRLLFPYVLVAVLGGLTNLNTMAVVYLDAGLFIGSFILLLGAFRHYAGRSIKPVETLLLGLLWFSIVDTENALWAFQIAWYVVLLCLMAMLYLLGRPRLSTVHLGGALAIAVVATYSSIQGLILWPIGLIAVLWCVRDRRRPVVASAWVTASVVTTFLYFRGFDFSPKATGGGSSGYALHHVLPTLAFVLALIGNVFPTSGPRAGLHEVIGAVILVGALGIVVGSIRSVRRSATLPLPLLLVVFALLFDLSIAAGRVSFGIGRADAPRYTMANLLILVALAIYVFSLPRTRPAEGGSPFAARTVLIGTGLVLVILGQVALSTAVGLPAASAWTKRIEAGDAIVVHLYSIPQPNRTLLFGGYVFPSLAYATNAHWVQMVHRDHLGELAPATAAQYRHATPPSP
jgi:hypothetical protein